MATLRCNGPFTDAETCVIHGPEIRKAKVNGQEWHQIVLAHRETESDDLTLFQLAENLETYEFECQGGPLKNCVDWLRIKEALKLIT